MNVGLLWVALGGGCKPDDDTGGGGSYLETDTDTDSDADTDTDSDADTDADTDTDFSFAAEGAFDEIPFTVDCPPNPPVGLRTDEGLSTVVSVLCAEGRGDSVYTLVISATNPSVGTIDTCDDTTWMSVNRYASKETHDCRTGGDVEFELSVTEMESDESATVWGGTFTLETDDDAHSTDVSGSFRVRSVVDEGG